MPWKDLFLCHSRTSDLFCRGFAPTVHPIRHFTFNNPFTAHFKDYRDMSHGLVAETAATFLLPSPAFIPENPGTLPLFETCQLMLAPDWLYFQLVHVSFQMDLPWILVLRFTSPAFLMWMTSRWYDVHWGTFTARYRFSDSGGSCFSKHYRHKCTSNCKAGFWNLFSGPVLLAHLVYQPKSLIQSCLVHRASSLASSLLASSVHTSPSHRFKYRSFLFGTDMHLCSPHILIKYLVILACSF